MRIKVAKTNSGGTKGSELSSEHSATAECSLYQIINLFCHKEEKGVLVVCFQVEGISIKN